MSNTMNPDLALPRTAAALAVFDEIDSDEPMTDTAVCEWLQRRAASDRAIWEAFADETADRNNRDVVLGCSMDFGVYESFIRSTVSRATNVDWSPV